MKPLSNLSGRQCAVLAVLAMLILATPVAQLWRQHGAQLSAVVDAQDALRPIRLALATQRALHAHRPLAGAVLRGQHEQERTRLVRQAEVDLVIGPLADALLQRHHFRALDEANAMHDGWLQVVNGIVSRTSNAQACETAHDLLVEQAMLIVDLEQMAGGVLGDAAPQAAWQLALTDLPHLNQALMRADETRARAIAAQIGPRLQELIESPTEPALAQALIALRLATEQVTRGLHLPPAAAMQAMRASEELQPRLQAWLQGRVADSVHAASQRRQRLALFTAAWAAAFLALLGFTLAGSRRRPGAAEATGAASAGTSGAEVLLRPAATMPARSQSPAAALLQRMRHRGAPDAPAPGASRSEEDRQPG